MFSLFFRILFRFIFTEKQKLKCSRCTSVSCSYCFLVQTEAITEVENLLIRLEDAEKLFPSTKAMGSHFPLYRSEAFISRIKTMCLWLNMTKHTRLQLNIVGKILFR